MPSEIPLRLDHVRPRRFPYSLLFHDAAFAIYPHVYVPRLFFTLLTEGQMNPFMESVLAHEQVHLDRQEKVGVKAWYVRYYTDSVFRLDEEIVAIQAQLALLVSRGVEFEIGPAATSLSSFLYFRMISREAAEQLLSDLWMDAKRARG